MEGRTRASPCWLRDEGLGQREFLGAQNEPWGKVSWWQWKEAGKENSKRG